MSIENDLLELKEVETELVDVGESLDDLSLVKLEFVNDTHWGDFETTLYIFGAGDPDETCPVFETRVDTEVLLTEFQGLQGLSCRKLSALFAKDLVNEITVRGIPVICNQGDETEASIDLSDPGDQVLLPMIR